MYFLWWPNHIVHVHVSKVAKSRRIVCENIASVHKFLILWWFGIWEHLNTLTHNHNCLMGTITFEIHLITPTSPRNTLATIFLKHLIIFAFIFFAYIYIYIFLFEHIMHEHIRERRNTQLCKPKHHNFAMPKHIDVIHDWGTLLVRWLFMPFS